MMGEYGHTHGTNVVIQAQAVATASRAKVNASIDEEVLKMVGKPPQVPVLDEESTDPEDFAIVEALISKQKTRREEWERRAAEFAKVLHVCWHEISVVSMLTSFSAPGFSCGVEMHPRISLDSGLQRLPGDRIHGYYQGTSWATL
jgi:hypothetical protein